MPSGDTTRLVVTGTGLMELIWSYWQEEGMLAQAFSAIALRFQNIRRPGYTDPLGELELDPLRPLNAFIWGWIEDEPSRLSMVRRAYEYNHHYGLSLVGRAVRQFKPADPRSRFIEAFHNLLGLTAKFYLSDDDTMVVSDAFPILHSLRDVHLLVAEAAHNQFRDLPWAARSEMLMQQWLFARPEMREFLRGRHMVPYKEDWMGAVDAMKRLQGWTDVGVTFFNDLAKFGERLLLSIRYTLWNDIDDPDVAKAWARYFRQEVQGYIHAYRAATGVDLTSANGADATMPGIHLARRLEQQQAGKAIRRLTRP